MRWAPRLRPTDLWWLLATPLYLLIGTIRHEGSHAVAALLHGWDITRFVFWPQNDQGYFTWGYVSWTGGSSWTVDAAPYLVDFVVFALGVGLCRRVTRHWVWLNVLVLTALSSFLNSLWNYRPKEHARGDVWWLLLVLPDGIVHAWFLLTLTVYAIGVLVLVGTIRPAGRQS